MNHPHPHPFLICIVLALSSAAVPAQGAESAKRWRLSTEADLPPGAVLLGPAVSAEPATAEPTSSAAMRVSIDPISNEIIEVPVLAPLPQRTPSASPPDFSLQRTPEGYLYIDTTALQNVQVMSIDEDGSMHANCYLPNHAHRSGAEVDSAQRAPASETPERQP